MTAENLVLQKLQHDRGKGFADAVDFIQKKNALLQSGFFHQVINGCDDFAHRIFADVAFYFATLITFMYDKWQPQCALAGMMCHGIGEQRDAHLAGDLFHDGGFADTRRAHQKNRTLLVCGH